MKKLNRKGPSVVHPSPLSISDQLAFLPASIFTLTLALSPDDREVLAYLLSCSNNFSAHPNNHIKNDSNSKTRSGGCQIDAHPRPAVFGCSCFRCYKSFWIRWDASSNRELIHEIIDAFEEDELVKKRESKGKKEKTKKKGKSYGKRDPTTRVEKQDESLNKVQSMRSGGEDEVLGDEELLEKGSSSSVKKLVSLIGDGIWTSIWSYRND